MGQYAQVCCALHTPGEQALGKSVLLISAMVEGQLLVRCTCSDASILPESSWLDVDSSQSTSPFDSPACFSEAHIPEYPLWRCAFLCLWSGHYGYKSEHGSCSWLTGGGQRTWLLKTHSFLVKGSYFQLKFP